MLWLTSSADWSSRRWCDRLSVCGGGVGREVSGCEGGGGVWVRRREGVGRMDVCTAALHVDVFVQLRCATLRGLRVLTGWVSPWPPRFPVVVWVPGAVGVFLPVLGLPFGSFLARESVTNARRGLGLFIIFEAIVQHLILEMVVVTNCKMRHYEYPEVLSAIRKLAHHRNWLLFNSSLLFWIVQELSHLADAPQPFSYTPRFSAHWISKAPWKLLGNKFWICFHGFALTG